ncbi:MAG: DUF3488 and transglutaminase-like domain-containing protein [Actinomycetota bacterium]
MSSRPTVATTRHRSPVVTEALAAAALTLFTITVALGFSRVFAGWEFARTLVVVAIVAHLAGALLRLARVPFVVAVPLTIAVVIWTISWIFYRDTFGLGLPNSETWSRFRLDLDLVGERFRTEVAPVPFLQGWDVLAALGVGLVAVLADTFAFRAFARAEALVPGGVLFVFISALGTDRSRVAATALLVGVGVLAAIALRVHHAPNDVPTIGRTRGSAARLAVPGVVAMVAVVAAGSAVIGPRIPGAGAEAIYDTTNGTGGGRTTVLSPLVDIRSRLTNRSDTELFVVESTADAYWRSSTLAEFDGRRWELPERPLRSTGDPLGSSPEGSVEIRQRITVTSLGGALVPAAADPIQASPVDRDGADLRYNPDSSTLVQTGDELASGDAFEIVSAAPRFAAEQLRTATSTDAGDPIYLELPDSFPQLARDTAAEITAGAATPYDVALTLQQWMRTEFRYSLEIQEGHGNNEIESFLLNRVGYCEQFAGTYAAMMRSLGFPSRVAVGFTPGLSEGDGRYSVLGKNAHAWPEIWFDQYGWVPFEPTPGRGAPGAENYTGVPQQQDDTPVDAGAGGGPGDDGGPAPTTVPPTTVVTDDALDGTPIPTTAPGTAGGTDGDVPDLGSLIPDDEGGATPASVAAEEPGVQVPWRALALVLFLGLLATVPAVVRRFRRRPTGPQVDQLARLWTRATTSLTDVGVTTPTEATPAEVARLVGEGFPTAARPIEALAGVVTEVTYGPAGPARLSDDGSYGTTVLGNCGVWTKQIEKAVTDSMPIVARLKRYSTRWT